MIPSNRKYLEGTAVITRRRVWVMTSTTEIEIEETDACENIEAMMARVRTKLQKQPRRWHWVETKRDYNPQTDEYSVKIHDGEGAHGDH